MRSLSRDGGRACRSVVLAVLMGMAPAAARAEPSASSQPFVTPQHDVDVVYTMLPGEAASVATQRLRWSASLQAQRIDIPGSPVYMVTDHRSRLTASVRLDGSGFVKQSAPDPVPPPGTPASGGYVRLPGPEPTIAGLTCAEWQVAGAGSQSGLPNAGSIVCLTADGVLLRARIGERVLLQAQSVREAPLDPALFAIPDARPG